MNGKSVLGMIFANIHEEALDSLTAMRTMAVSYTHLTLPTKA